MSPDRSEPGDPAGALRRAFDQSFAEAPPAPPDGLEDFLCIGTGTTSCALRLSEISALLSDMSITSLATPFPDLLGITSFRGTVLAVYDLSALLRRPKEARPRLLAIAAGTLVALAFERFEGHIRVGRGAIVRQDRVESPLWHTQEAVRAGGELRPIVSVASIVEAITRRVRPGLSEKER